MRTRVTARSLGCLILAVAAGAWLTTGILSGGPSPGGERINIPGLPARPNRIDRLPSSLDPYGKGVMAARTNGRVYVRVWEEDPELESSSYRLYTKSVEGEWEVVIPDAESDIQLRRRAGSDEIYFSECAPHRDAHRALRLYRITGEGEVAEVTDDYWTGLSEREISDSGIRNCLASWAVLPDGGVILAARDALWKVDDGRLEILIDLIPAELGISNRPEISVGEHGEVLVYSKRGQPGSQSAALLIVGDELTPIDLGSEYGIEEAVIGPDGAACFLVKDSHYSDYRGFRVIDGEVSEFMSKEQGITIGIYGLSFDASGNLYMVYGVDGEWFVRSKWWVLGFLRQDAKAE